MSRKESIKKSLGISEYPWSSDDDETESASTAREPHSTRQEHSLNNNPFQTEVPGPSGSSAAAAAASGNSRRRNQLFWSLSLTSPQRVTSRSRIEMPRLSMLSRPFSMESRGSEPASGTSPTDGSQSVQRILALRKVNRNCYRPTKLYSNSSRGSPPPPGRRELPPEATAILKRRNAMQHSPEFSRNAPTLNAAVAGEPQASGSGPPRRAPPAAPPLPPPARDHCGAGEEAELEVEMTSPPIPSIVDLDADVADVGVSGVSLGEMSVDPAADGPTDHHNLQALENHAENEEPEATSAGSEKSQPQSKKVGAKRKRDAEEAAEPITVKEFNLNLLRLLECPVCLEWMEPPMSQCRRGHLVCGRCRARLDACPVCRTAFSSVRNRAMEGVAEMVRYPCRHGCGREVRLRSRTSHEASCAARRYRCPAPACEHRAPLPHCDLAHHLQDKHPLMVRLGWKHKFALKLTEEHHDNWVIMALHQLFHLRIDVDIRSWALVLYVAYIGPKCKSSHYTYEVTIEGQHSSRRMSYTRATHCDLECSMLNVGRQDCFRLTLAQALNFLRDTTSHSEQNKYLCIDVEIARTKADDDEESES